MFKKGTGTEAHSPAPKPMLPDEKITDVVRLMESGTDESIQKINEMIGTYKFTSINLAEIIRLAPIGKILNLNLSLIHPKAVVRILACCVNVLHKSRDERLKYKCRRILDITCERLHMINFGKEEFLELAEIDDSRISDYVQATSNSWDVQTKVMLPRDKAAYVVQILESGENKNLDEINGMIEQYKFSYEKLTDILKAAPLGNLVSIDTSLLNPKILVRVIACCVRVLKEEDHSDIIEKFNVIFNFTFEKLQQMNLTIKEYLELAHIDDPRVRTFVEQSNHTEVQAVLESHY